MQPEVALGIMVFGLVILSSYFDYKGQKEKAKFMQAKLLEEQLRRDRVLAARKGDVQDEAA